MTTTFTSLPGHFTNRAEALAIGEATTLLALAAHLTATREFAELGQPTLAKWMFQIGAQIAEQHAVVRTTAAVEGVPEAIPPNNRAFATDLFLYTREVIDLMKTVGLIGGSGTVVSYPGRAAVLAAAGPMAEAILQKKPNNATSLFKPAGLSSVNGERS